MAEQANRLHVLPCLDSDEVAAERRRELDIRWDIAAELGRSAVLAADNGFYFNLAGEEVAWRHFVMLLAQGSGALRQRSHCRKANERHFPKRGFR